MSWTVSVGDSGFTQSLEILEKMGATIVANDYATTIVDPLYFGEKPLGCALVKVGETEAVLFEAASDPVVSPYGDVEFIPFRTEVKVL